MFCFLQIAAISLGTVSATFAWFINRRTAVVSAEGFQVVLPEAQKVAFYRQKYNNFIDSGKNCSGGFEKEKLGVEKRQSFIQIDVEESNQFSDSTKNLWPNHQICYAMVFKPIRDGDFTFSLTDYVSKPSTEKFLKNGKGLSLSFAIDLFAKAYEYDGTFTSKVDVILPSANSFFSTQGSTDNVDKNEDLFKVDENSPNIQPNPYTFTVSKEKNYVLYFSILFSNDSSTYYSEVTEGNETYYKKDPNSISQSNCYEGLTFSADKFTLKAPEAS